MFKKVVSGIAHILKITLRETAHLLRNGLREIAAHVFRNVLREIADILQKVSVRLCMCSRMSCVRLQIFLKII